MSSDQCGRIWRILATLGKYSKVLGNFRLNLLFGKILDLLWQILYAIGQIFVDVNAKNVEK